MGRTYRQSIEYATAKLWRQVEKGAECWLWTGYVDRDGYGLTHWLGALRRVHRIVYTLESGIDLPPGMTVDHLCFTRNCVWPEHLEAVPHAVNAARQRSALRTHCGKGHEYTERNTYVTKAGGRQCRACQAICVRRYAAKRKGVAS